MIRGIFWTCGGRSCSVPERASGVDDGGVLEMTEGWAGGNFTIEGLRTEIALLVQHWTSRIMLSTAGMVPRMIVLSRMDPVIIGVVRWQEESQSE